MDHASARFVHTKRAFEERYGIEYTPVLEEYIKLQITYGEAVHRHTKPDGTSSQYVVTLACGTKVIIAQDNVTLDICTVLTSGMYKPKRQDNKKKRNPKRNKKTNWEM